MSISFFIPDSPTTLVKATDEFPHLSDEDFADDPFIKCVDGIPYIEKSVFPEVNFSIYTYHFIIKNIIRFVTDSEEKSNIEEGWGEWSGKEQLTKVKSSLLAYLATGARNDVREDMTIEGIVTFCGYSLDRIENIIYSLIEVVDSAIEHDAKICWG